MESTTAPEGTDPWNDDDDVEESLDNIAETFMSSPVLDFAWTEDENAAIASDTKPSTAHPVKEGLRVVVAGWQRPLTTALLLV
jgi:hypothetical protein